MKTMSRLIVNMKFPMFNRCVEKFNLFLYFLPAFILWFFDVKVPNFAIARIGHLAAEPDCYIKEHLLSGKKIPRTILLASSYSVANEALAKLWGDYFYVVHSRLVAKILRPLTRHPLTRFDTLKYIADDQAISSRIATNWGNRKPIIRLKPELLDRGRVALEHIGVPVGAIFVCIHVRGSGYSPNDEYIQKYRNSGLKDYDLAIDWLIDKGIYCVRIGDSTMEPMAPRRGLIDYAISPYKSDWLDLFLISKCLFLLGTNSGPTYLAGILGTPLACANMVPMVTTFPWGPKDLGIPKLYCDKVSGRLMSFKEIFSSGAANFRYDKQYGDRGIILVENSSDEILDLVIECFDMASGRCHADENVKVLQDRFKSLLTSGDYTFGTSSNIGSTFIKKYQELLN
jgi:putative glycosyltransferase (TIGR04372 family)